MRIWIGTTKVEIRNDSFQVDRVLSTKKPVLQECNTG